MKQGGTKMEDARIVELYWARDEQAIAESDRRYGAMLTGIAYGVLQSREDTEECVSDTYVRAWDRIPPDRPVYLGAFLGRITRRLAIDRLRSDRALKRGGGSPLSELTECVPARETAEEAVDARLLADAIARWLRALPAEERVLFVRRYWYGDGLDTLAVLHRTVPNKLAGRLFRLRQKLRAFLEKEELL